MKITMQIISFSSTVCPVFSGLPVSTNSCLLFFDLKYIFLQRPPKLYGLFYIQFHKHVIKICKLISFGHILKLFNYIHCFISNFFHKKAFFALISRKQRGKPVAHVTGNITLNVHLLMMCWFNINWHKASSDEHKTLLTRNQNAELIFFSRCELIHCLKLLFKKMCVSNLTYFCLVEQNFARVWLAFSCIFRSRQKVWMEKR